MSPKERRKQPRISIKRAAEVKQENTETGEQLADTGATADVSEGGIRFKGREIFDPFRKVEISFSLGEEKIEAKGKVIHLTLNSRGTVDMGIQFEALDDQARDFLKSYCKSTEPGKK